MNNNEFMAMYGNVSQKTKVLVKCKCGVEKNIYREKAKDNIDNNGEYRCGSCSATKWHSENPMSEETKEKLKKGRLGKKHTEESKLEMSKSKKEYFKTEEGKLAKVKLSALAAEQHKSKKFNRSKRKILYISAKHNNDIRVCNSSYEFIACEDFLETNADIVYYETQVFYQVENRSRSLDILITYRDGSKKAIEIKPKSRLNEADHVDQLLDSAANAEVNGYIFEIWTEDELGIKNIKEATARADEYRKKNYLIDYSEYRKARKKISVKKHYDSKITIDKVIIFCDFCKSYHSRLRKTYEKNVKKNNRYICIRENGHNIGSLSKDHRKVQLDESGLKQCQGACGLKLSLDNFSPNGEGKYYSKCKVCHSVIEKSKYIKRERVKKEMLPPTRGKYKGVSFKKNRNKFTARICIDKEIHLGYFLTEEEAAQAYDKHALEIFGKGNCYLNFPENAE